MMKDTDIRFDDKVVYQTYVNNFVERNCSIIDITIYDLIVWNERKSVINHAQFANKGCILCSFVKFRKGNNHKGGH